MIANSKAELEDKERKNRIKKKRKLMGHTWKSIEERQPTTNRKQLNREIDMININNQREVIEGFSKKFNKHKEK